MFRCVRIGVAVAALGAAAVIAPSAGAYDVNQAVIVSPTPVKYTPNILDGTVYATAQAGDEMIVGGTFTSVKGHGAAAAVTRNEIVVFNATTGEIDPNFAPDIEGGEVSTISVAPGGQAVFVGGQFSTVTDSRSSGWSSSTWPTGRSTPASTRRSRAAGSRTPRCWATTSTSAERSPPSTAPPAAACRGQPRHRRRRPRTSNVNFAAKRQGTLRVAHMDDLTRTAPS